MFFRVLLDKPPVFSLGWASKSRDLVEFSGYLRCYKMLPPFGKEVDGICKLEVYKFEVAAC